MPGLLGLASYRMALVGVLGAFSLRGPTWRRIPKAFLALLLLPDACIRLHARHRRALALLAQYPQVPSLADGQSNE